jgi:23S rRNA pseudouridine2605 synthase
MSVSTILHNIPAPRRHEEEGSMQDMRLQKVIAQAGLASRRKAETLITQGCVSVNGRLVTTPGMMVDPAVDIVVVNGRRLARRTALIYMLLHKPRGYMTTCDDEQGRPTVFDLLKPQLTRLFPVGRLDCNSEGVLLLTNDGALANRLLHPRYRIARTYVVKIQGAITDEEVERLRRGVILEDGRTMPAQVQVTRRSDKSSVLRLTLYEGRHRQIHRMLQRCGGYTVKRLQRVAMGPLTLAGLPPGAARPLEPFEVSRLQRACQIQSVAS